MGGGSDSPATKAANPPLSASNAVGDGLRRMFGDVVEQRVPDSLASLIDALEDALARQPARGGGE